MNPSRFVEGRIYHKSRNRTTERNIIKLQWYSLTYTLQELSEERGLAFTVRQRLKQPAKVGGVGIVPWRVVLYVYDIYGGTVKAREPIGRLGRWVAVVVAEKCVCVDGVWTSIGYVGE